MEADVVDEYLVVGVDCKVVEEHTEVGMLGFLGIVVGKVD